MGPSGPLKQLDAGELVLFRIMAIVRRRLSRPLPDLRGVTGDSRPMDGAVRARAGRKPDAPWNSSDNASDCISDEGGRSIRWMLRG
ncbi:MAG: hypothetical protein LKE51_09535 [Selenomonas sp.]|nr:hypothetical protein [Selenomonas sp.]